MSHADKPTSPQLTSASPSETRSRHMKRYQLVLPEELFDAVQHLADERQTTVVDLIRRFIKLGLIAAQIENTPGAALIIRKDDSEQQILFL